MILNSKILQFINLKNIKDFEPYYVYDSELIKEQCRIFRKIEYENKAIHFATMANINSEFLKIVKNHGVKVFVNSLLHLKEVLKTGFRNEEIIYTASALSESIMREINSCNIQLNLDSPAQLHLWKSIFPDKPVGIRCNIGDAVKPYANHAGTFIGKESRLGFSIDEILEIEDRAFIKGLHIYVGTDITEIDYFINCYKELIKLLDIFPNIEYLNFGGGFGIKENGEKHFNMSVYNNKLTQLMHATSEKYGRSIKLILEPGRIIGGAAGYFVCCVTDVKQRNIINLVGLNASTVQFSRPLMYPETALHPVAVVRNKVQISEVPEFNTILYGCSTYSRDIFRKDFVLPEMHIEDVVVFGNAGSYSASSHSLFLGFPKPDEYFI